LYYVYRAHRKFPLFARRGRVYHHRQAIKGLNPRVDSAASLGNKVDMRRVWLSASAGLAIVIAVSAAGCVSDAIKENQRQLDQQKAELEQLKQQVADLKNAQTPSYPTTAPLPGSCDKAVMQVATRHGGERFAASEFDKALGYYQDAITACPISAQAQLNVARAYEALGDRDRAMDYYKRAIQSAPSDDAAVAEQANEALARLAAK
jgi:tetratricopeptide (TPR) repeat protein